MAPMLIIGQMMTTTTAAGTRGQRQTMKDNNKDNHKMITDNKNNHHKMMTGMETETDNDIT